MEHNEALESRKRAADQIRRICSEYGMHGSLVYHEPSSIPGSNRNRIYLVAGMNPELDSYVLPKGVYPEDIIRRQERNNRLFYPNIWAFDLTENNNQMKATEELVDYLKIAEFIKTIYAEYGLEPPEKLRVSEAQQLITAKSMSSNMKLSAQVRKKSKRGLDWFFKRERSGGLRRKWLDYYRSEHFSDEKGPISKLFGFFRQNRQQTDIKQLMEVNEDVHKLQMQEHEYKLFKNFISKVYPDVVYAAGEKNIVDHGGVSNPKETRESEESEEPIIRRITGEEYAVIRKDRFAEEGWSALKNVQEAYWEVRDVYFKACDEPLVAAAYNSITLQYAKCDPLGDLIDPVHMIDVPVTDFMNFVALAKNNKFRFYIDNAGDFAVPSLENVHVIYSKHQTEKLQDILSRMVNDKVEFSHVLDTIDRPALSQVIKEMEHLRSGHKPEHIITPDRGRN